MRRETVKSLGQLPNQEQNRELAQSMSASKVQICVFPHITINVQGFDWILKHVPGSMEGGSSPSLSVTSMPGTAFKWVPCTVHCRYIYHFTILSKILESIILPYSSPQTEQVLQCILGVLFMSPHPVTSAVTGRDLLRQNHECSECR